MMNRREAFIFLNRVRNISRRFLESGLFSNQGLEGVAQPVQVGEDVVEIVQKSVETVEESVEMDQVPEVVSMVDIVIDNNSDKSSQNFIEQNSSPVPLMNPSSFDSNSTPVKVNLVTLEASEVVTEDKIKENKECLICPTSTPIDLLTSVTEPIISQKQRELPNSPIPLMWYTNLIDPIQKLPESLIPVSPVASCSKATLETVLPTIVSINLPTKFSLERKSLSPSVGTDSDISVPNNGVIKDSSTNQTATTSKITRMSRKRVASEASYVGRKSKRIKSRIHYESSSSDDDEELDNVINEYLKKLSESSWKISWGKKKKICNCIRKMQKLFDQAKNNNPSKEDTKLLEHYMGETYKLRFDELYNNKISIKTVVRVFPGLKVFSQLQTEYSWVYYKERKSYYNLKQSIDMLLTSLVDSHISSGTSIYDASKDALAAYRRNPSPDLKLVVGAILFAVEQSKGKVTGRLFLQRKSEDCPDIVVSTPFIDVTDEKPLWELDSVFKIFVEFEEIILVKNFYEALITVYLYYWILYLDYSKTDEKIFKKFDKIAKL